MLEDGRPYNEGRKYKQAVEKKVKTLDLSAFEKYVQDKTKNPNWTMDNSNKNNISEDIEIEEEKSNELNDKKKTKNTKNQNKISNFENKGELVILKIKENCGQQNINQKK